MARGRIIDKALFQNEDLAEVDMNCRLFYIGLIVHADDEGRLKANAKFLRALIFPFDVAIRVETVTSWLNALHSAQLISLYVADGKEYLSHPNWEKWQPLRKDRVKPSNCPPCPPDSVSCPQVDNQCQPDDNQVSTKCQPDDNQVSTKCQPDDRITQPNQTRPNKTNSNALSPSSLRSERDKAGPPVDVPALILAVKNSGFDVYAALGNVRKRFGGRKVWFPDDVVAGVCRRYLADTGKIRERWPWFERVLKAEAEMYYAERARSEGEAWKKTKNAKDLDALVNIILAGKE